MKHNKPLSKKLFKLLQTIIVQNIYKLSLHSKSNNPDLNDVLFSEKEFKKKWKRNQYQNQSAIILFALSSMKYRLDKEIYTYI